MTIDSIDTLLTEELKDIYDAEKQITKALPKMAKAASAPELKQAFEEHLEITKKQISRLEEVFELLDEKASSKTCAGMKGLLQEGEEVMKEDVDEEVLHDAAIIGAAQKVEHYEIAAYGTVRTFAQMLGNDQVVDLLEQTLEEEKEADRKLTEISEALLQGISEEGEEYTESMEDEEPGIEESQGPPVTRRRRSGS
jgi:ferritin-like metal-binding protein YciE